MREQMTYTMSFHRRFSRVALSDEVKSQVRTAAHRRRSNSHPVAPNNEDKSDDNDPQKRIRMLEEQLISMKMELGAAGSREDNLMLLIQRLTKFSEEKVQENRALKMEIKKSHGAKHPRKSNANAINFHQSDGKFLEEQDFPRVLAVPTFKDPFDADYDDDEDAEIVEAPGTLTSVGLTYLNKNAKVSMLSIHSAFSSVGNKLNDEEKEENEGDKLEYFTRIRFDNEENRGRRVNRRSSCASGLEFLKNLNSTCDSIQDFHQDEQTENSASVNPREEGFEDALFV
mmetsp:Transcript_5009/g.10706  ORF Transcript_5009/g.10706 Transcript_5009/m.10706 type:complete len:285 (-) Transcript_5009:78-932(-)